MNNLAHLILIGFWLFGIVVAEGVLSTFFAIILPFWAWYLVWSIWQYILELFKNHLTFVSIYHTLSIVKLLHAENKMGLADLIFEDYTPSPAEMMDEINAMLDKEELDLRMEEAKKVIKSLHDGTWQADYSQVNITGLSTNLVKSPNS